MQRVDFYLDFISPFAWLAFQKLPEALQGLSVEVRYRPVLLGALLRHHGQLGPAEVAPKRDWTYRHVMWLGHQLGVPLRMPASHPFNPLPLLRLAMACAPSPLVSGGDAARAQPSRWQCEQLFRHVWLDGLEATDAQRMAALAAELRPEGDPQGEVAKAALKANTDAAVADGVFGVPAFVVRPDGQEAGELFWGLDSLPMLRAWLQADPWLRSPEARPSVPSSLARQR